MICSIDDTDASIYSHTRTPDANLLAGIIIPESEEVSLIQIIEGVKSKYGLKGRPIKYNNRGTIRDYYLKNIKRPDLYDALTFNQSALKSEIIKMASGINFHVVISWNLCSCVPENYAKEKSQNITSSFLDILNASIKYLPRYKNEKFEIILDRFHPKQQPIIEDTLANWKEPQLETGLKEAFFSFHSGVTLQNELLQLTDLIAGTFKDLIQDCLKDKPFRSSNYVHLTPKLAGFPNKIAGTGLIGPPQFQDKIVKALMSSIKNNAHSSLTNPLPPLGE